MTRRAFLEGEAPAQGAPSFLPSPLGAEKGIGKEMPSRAFREGSVKEAFENALEGARRENPRDMYGAGVMYYYGIGPETGRDEEKAFQWLTRAVESGSVYGEKAKLLLSQIYSHGCGEGARQSFGEAFRLLSSLDKEAFPSQYFNGMASMILSGLGHGYLPEEIQEFLCEHASFFSLPAKRRAADYLLTYGKFSKARGLLETLQEEDAYCQFLLGEIFFKGLEEPSQLPSPGKARGYYERADRAGLLKATQRLGVIHLQGAYDLPQNLPLAREYFQRGAEMGDVTCQYYYGWMCRYALGGGREGKLAASYLERAAEQDFLPALPELILLYLQSEMKNEKRAFFWAKRGAELEDGPCQLLLGSLYLTGRGCDRDPEKARFYLRRAAQQGLLEAWELLEREGGIGPKGDGVRPRLGERLPVERQVFYGREEELKEIDKAFQEGHRVVFLEGMGAIGKSELAKQYALQYRERYDTIVFVTYSSSLQSLVCDPDAFLMTGGEKKSGETQEEWFGRRLRLLQTLTDERTLIITDNYNTDSDPHFSDYVRGSARMLFTTRVSHPDGFSIPVERISEKEALVKIFLQNTGWENRSLSQEERKILLEIFEKVDSHTYAIELLAKQRRASRLSLEELRGRMEEGAWELEESVVGLSGESASAYQHIQAVFCHSRLYEEEKQVLRLLSFLGTEGIPARFFKEWAGLPSYQLINELKESSWIREDGQERLSLHPVVGEVVRHDLSPGMENCGDFLERMGDYLYGAWERPLQEKASLKGCLLAAAKYFAPFEGMPVGLWCGVNTCLWQVGAMQWAIHYQTLLYQTCQKTYGEKSLESGFAAQILGDCYFTPGYIEESFGWFERAVWALEGICQEGEELAHAYDLLGKQYYFNENHRDFDRASLYFEKALKLRQRLKERMEGGEKIYLLQGHKPYSLLSCTDHMGTTYYQLGRMYLLKGEYDKSLEMFKESEGIRGDFFSGRNPASYAMLLMYKGLCYYERGRNYQKGERKERAREDFEAALENLKSSLELNIRYRGEAQLDTIDNLEALGDVQAALGENVQARLTYERGIFLLYQMYGEDSARLERIRKKAEEGKRLQEKGES